MKFRGTEQQGQTAAMPMTDDFEVISSYTDQQAVEDGVLVPVTGEGGVNRVTRAVFDRFTKPMGASSITGPVTNIGPLMEAIRAMVKLPADADGLRTGAYQGEKIWIVPNEVGGLTMMFPDDY
jgi:hypothetical protein